jgi:8-oxo-dGTP pyrophosphatase MutT (NUDIX family)
MSEIVENVRRRGSVGVIPHQGRLLVIRRSQWVVAPRRFCFPGGGIEAGETEEVALVRELQEELGTLVRPVRRLWESITPWRVHLAWWLAELDPLAQLVPDPAEVESIHWYTPTELGVLPELLESNHSFLHALATGQIELAL